MKERIPRDTLAQIDAYVRDRQPPGGFLVAVFSNDLEAACKKADARNLAALADIVDHVYDHCPIECRGHPQRVDAWIRFPPMPGSGSEDDHDLYDADEE